MVQLPWIPGSMFSFNPQAMVTTDDMVQSPWIPGSTLLYLIPILQQTIIIHHIQSYTFIYHHYSILQHQRMATNYSVRCSVVGFQNNQDQPRLLIDAYCLILLTAYKMYQDVTSCYYTISSNISNHIQSYPYSAHLFFSPS